MEGLDCLLDQDDDQGLGTFELGLNFVITSRVLKDSEFMMYDVWCYRVIMLYIDT